MVHLEDNSDYTALPRHGSQQLPWITTPLLYSNGLSDAAGWFVPHSIPSSHSRSHEPRNNISPARST